MNVRCDTAPGARPPAAAGLRHALGVCARACAAIVAAGAALAALASGAQAQAAAAVQIEMGERGSEYFFTPKEVTVPAGAVRFTFRNAGARRHNFVVRLPGGEQRIPDVSAGSTYEQTFTLTQPGTYDFLCDLPMHAQRGMTGKLTVEAGPGAAPGPGAAATTAPATPGPGTPGAGSPSTADTRAAAIGGSAAGLPLFVSLAIHIPAAIAWLGIVLYQAIVVAVPYLNPAQRGGLLQRPRWLVLLTIPLFGVTGVYQTIYNPISTVTDIASLEALRHTTTYGLALFWKHGFVLTSMALTLAVTFWFAPRLAALADDKRAVASPPSNRTALLAWANVAACVALLVCVSVIVFQLH